MCAAHVCASMFVCVAHNVGMCVGVVGQGVVWGYDCPALGVWVHFGWYSRCL